MLFVIHKVPKRDAWNRLALPAYSDIDFLWWTLKDSWNNQCTLPSLVLQRDQWNEARDGRYKQPYQEFLEDNHLTCVKVLQTFQSCTEKAWLELLRFVGRQSQILPDMMASKIINAACVLCRRLTVRRNNILPSTYKRIYNTSGLTTNEELRRNRPISGENNGPEPWCILGITAKLHLHDIVPKSDVSIVLPGLKNQAEYIIWSRCGQWERWPNGVEWML